jgi:hypothetical protein
MLIPVWLAGEDHGGDAGEAEGGDYAAQAPRAAVAGGAAHVPDQYGRQLPEHFVPEVTIVQTYKNLLLQGGNYLY